MPKNTSAAILRRWRAMDAWLTSRALGEGLNVPVFAKQWHVSTKTIHRDLAAFRELGQKMLTVDVEDDRRTYWHYAAHGSVVQLQRETPWTLNVHASAENIRHRHGKCG